MEGFAELSPVAQAVLAGCFTWSVTALGAASVFAFREVGRKLLDVMLGFAGGVMLAASYWSLLAPAIAISEQGSLPAWLPPSVGFLAGGLVLYAIDQTLPHLHPFVEDRARAEGLPTQLRRRVLLVLAITLHNIPEGLAVGVAFAGVVAGIPGAGLGAAIALALGIGLQNLPEGVAVSMPLRAGGMSRTKAFWYGQLSGTVEPVAAGLGASAVLFAAPLLPYGLAFAAGAMVYVVVEELIPAAADDGNLDIATLALLVGFVVMMALDVGLG